MNLKDGVVIEEQPGDLYTVIVPGYGGVLVTNKVGREIINGVASGFTVDEITNRVSEAFPGTDRNQIKAIFAHPAKKVKRAGYTSSLHGAPPTFKQKHTLIHLLE